MMNVLMTYGNEVTTMDNVMKIIKEELGLAPIKITPEYLLKMYYKGYNAALDDMKDVIDEVQRMYDDTIQETVQETSVIYRGNLAKSCHTLVEGVCDNIVNNIHYKELPKK